MDKLCITTKRGKVQSAFLDVNGVKGHSNLSYSLFDKITDDECFIGADGKHATLEHKFDIVILPDGKLELSSQSFFEISDVGSHFQIQVFSRDVKFDTWSVIWPDLDGDGYFEIDLKKAQPNNQLPPDIITQKPDIITQKPDIFTQPPDGGIRPPDGDTQPPDGGKQQPVSTKWYLYLLGFVVVLTILGVTWVLLNNSHKKVANLECFDAGSLYEASITPDINQIYLDKCLVEITSMHDDQIIEFVQKWPNEDSRLNLEAGHFFNPYHNSEVFDAIKRPSTLNSLDAAIYYTQAMSDDLSADTHLKELCTEETDPAKMLLLISYCEKYK